MIFPITIEIIHGRNSMLLYIGNIIFGTVYIVRCLTNIMLHMLTAQTMATVNYFLIRWNNTNIYLFVCLFVCLMELNPTYSNSSVISWWSVLLVEETGRPGETTNLSQVTNKLYHVMLYSSP